MSNRKQLMADLDTLVKRANVQKTAALKTASIGDDTEDGTGAVPTGAQMASNKAEAAKGTAAMVDGGATTNPAGKTLEMATEGSTAVSTSGQEGGKGADLDIKHQAANGPEGGIKGDDKAGSKTASVKDIVAGLRKIAADLDAEETTITVTDKTAAVKPVEKTAAVKLLEKVFAPKPVSKLAQFFIKAAQDAGLPMGGDPAAGGMPPVDPAAAGGMPPVDPAAGGMPAGDPAAAGGGQQIIEQLIAALESGQIDEQQAQQMLMEAAQSGAISEQEIQEAMAALQGAGGDPAAGGAPAGGMPPAGDPAAMGGMPPAGGEMVEDPGLEAKVAQANVGPDDGEKYIAKLASLYADDVKAGYQLAVKVAEELTKAASIGDKVEDGTKDSKEGDAIAGNPDMKPAPAVKGEAVGTENQQDNDANNKLPVAKKANHEPGHDAGADKPGVDKGDVPAADAGASPAPAAPPAGAPPAAAAGGAPESALSPQDPAQQAMLLQVIQELGLTPEMLQQLMSQKPAPCADPAMAKAAAYKARAKAEILIKAAQLAESTPKV